jgi:site-specific recombinase XerD
MSWLLSNTPVISDGNGQSTVFPVQLPSGVRYWTLLSSDLRPIAEVDGFLQHVRFGRDGAESTTYTYAGGLALFLRWCNSTGREWQSAAGHLGMFVLWLRHAGQADDTVLQGPGAKPVRGPRRVNTVLASVREFLKHQVTLGVLSAAVLTQLYEIAGSRDLPIEARGEDGPRYYAKARHRVSEPNQPVKRATDQEMLALLQACRSARDRFIVLLLAREGLRRSEAAGLRRQDLHFLPESTMLRCPVAGAHLHVVRRDNANGAWAKSRRAGVVPADFLVVQSYDAYVVERDQISQARASDFVLVNLFKPPVGKAMPPRAINEVLERLSIRAKLDRIIHPHLLRHAFGSSVMDTGATLDEAQELLRHASVTSTQVYLHPSPDRLREAVERVSVGRPADTGEGR